MHIVVAVKKRSKIEIRAYFENLDELLDEIKNSRNLVVVKFVPVHLIFLRIEFLPYFP